MARLMWVCDLPAPVVDTLHIIPPALPHCNRCGRWLGTSRWRRGMVRCGPCVRVAGRSHVVRTLCRVCCAPLDPDRLWRELLCLPHYRQRRRRTDRECKRRLRLAGQDGVSA